MAQTENIKSINIEDENYPALLKKIANPPKTLYYKGILKKEEPCFAIVGTRRCSSYGRQVTFDITKKIAQSGLIVTSGLAPGIDTFAHQSTVRSNKRTIAVLGTGLDEESIYPKENIKLAREIVEKEGCLISEYPPKTKGARYTFPQRNRIISGLSFAVLVIESKESGGSMITASYALSQNKMLFAIPGSIYSFNSSGPHKLIKEGAIPVSNIYDILKEIPEAFLKKIESEEKTLNLANLSFEERIIIESLKEPLHIDKIIQITKLDAAKTASAISILEIKEKIKNIGENTYTLL